MIRASAFCLASFHPSGTHIFYDKSLKSYTLLLLDPRSGLSMPKQYQDERTASQSGSAEHK